MNWHVYYDKTTSQYKLSNKCDNFDVVYLASFKVFDMAYKYVTTLNGGLRIDQTYSRWTVQR